MNTDEEFAIFWQNFDPNYRYNEKTREFVRRLWEVVRNYNHKATMNPEMSLTNDYRNQ